MDLTKSEYDHRQWQKQLESPELTGTEMREYAIPSKLLSAGFLPTFAELILMVPAAYVFLHPLGLSYLLQDASTGTHLRTGEWILENGQVPQADLFSFSVGGRPWYAWEWLWDVTFEGVRMMGGLSAVALVSVGILCITYYLLYRRSVDSCGNPLVVFAMTMLAISVSSIHWLARPHLVTLLFSILAVWLVDKERNSRGWRLAWLPVLCALWVNVHGGFLMGILVAAAYGAGGILRWLVGGDIDERRRGLVGGGTFLLLAALSLLAGAVNPYGIKLYGHLWDYLRNTELLRTTVEFAPPDLISLRLLMLFALDSIAVAWFLFREEYERAVLIAGTAMMGLSSVRHIMVHLTISLPFLCQAVTELIALASEVMPQRKIRMLLSEVSEIGPEWSVLKSGWKSLAVPAVLALLLVVTCAHSREGTRWRASFDLPGVPVSAIDSLIGVDVDLKLLSTDSAGDYAIFRMFPRVKVFFDGRGDLYGSQFGKEFTRVVNASPGWSSALKKYGVTAVVLPIGTPLATALTSDGSWATTFEDKEFAVFLLSNPHRIK
ncbi:MAG TPA: hypothetical protein VGK29_13535 [Paludibaculum sp.]